MQCHEIKEDDIVFEEIESPDDFFTYNSKVEVDESNAKVEEENSDEEMSDTIEEDEVTVTVLLEDREEERSQ